MILQYKSFITTKFLYAYVPIFVSLQIPQSTHPDPYTMTVAAINPNPGLLLR